MCEERIPFFNIFIADDILQYTSIITKLLAIIHAHRNHIHTYRVSHIQSTTDTVNIVLLI